MVTALTTEYADTLRITAQLCRVLKALIDSPDHTAFGLQIAVVLGLNNAVVYRALWRLEHAGWVSSERRKNDGRSRRYYTLTEEGYTAARGALKALAAQVHV